MKRIEVRYRGQVNPAAVELLGEAGLDVVRLRPLVVNTNNEASGLNVVLAAARLMADVTHVLVYPHVDASAAGDLVAIY